MADDARATSDNTPDEHPAENIEKWKYDAMKRAILDALPADEEGLEFSRLPEMVERRLSSDELIGIGSVEQMTTTIVQDLQETEEIELVPASRPPRLRRVS